MNTLDRINFALEKIAYARAYEAEWALLNSMEKQARGGIISRLLSKLKGSKPNEVQQIAKGTRGTKEIKVTVNNKPRRKNKPQQQQPQQQQQQQPKAQRPKQQPKPQQQQSPVLPPVPPASPSPAAASAAQQGLLSRAGEWAARTASKADPALTNAGRVLGSGLASLGRGSSYIAKGLSQGTGKFIGAAGQGLGEAASNVGRGLGTGLSAAGKGLGAGIEGAIKGTAALTGGLGNLVGRGTVGTARGLASAFRRNPLATTALLGGGGLYALGDHADGFDSAWDTERTYGDNLYNIGHNIATGGNKAIDTVDSWVSPYMNQ